MMAHQSSKDRSERTPRSYLPPRQENLRSKNSLRTSSDFHLISPLSDLSDPSYSAFHRRSQGNVEEQEAAMNRRVLVMENVPHPDRISTQRTHVLPNDAAHIDKNDKRKAITKAFKGYVTGGAHRLGKMRTQTTKAVRHTSAAVKNVVAHGNKAKTEAETLNIVVEARNEGNMQWADESNTLGLLNVANDTSFEQLWCETKGLTPLMTLHKTFEDAYGLHREDAYFDKLTTAKGSPCAKPSFSLMRKGLSTRNISVPDPPPVDESVMSVYIDEPAEEGTELTGNALKKHDESIAEDTKYDFSMEDFSMNQSIYQYSFAQPETLSPVKVPPMVNESVMSVYVEEPAEEGTELSGNALKNHDESSDKIDDAPGTKQRPSSSADNLVYSPDHALGESMADEPFQENKHSASMEDFSMNQSNYQNSFNQLESNITYISEDFSPVKLMGDLLASEDSSNVLNDRGSESVNPESSVKPSDPEISVSRHETDDIVSIVSDTMSELRATGLSERHVSKTSLESEHHEPTLGLIASEDSSNVLKDRGSESVNPESSVKPSDPEFFVSRHETDDIVSIVSDTMSELPATGLSERHVSKTSLESEHHEPTLGDLGSTVSDISNQAPTAALTNHQDRKVSLETMNISSPHELEESTLGDLVFALGDMTSKSTTVTFPDHESRKVSLETTSSSSPQAEDVGSTATAMTHTEMMPELSEESMENEASCSRLEVKDLDSIATGSEMSPDKPKVQSMHRTKEVVEKRQRKNSIAKILRGKMTGVRLPKITATRGKTDIVCKAEMTKHEPARSEGQLRKSILLLASRSTDDADAIIESFSSEFMSLEVAESAPSVLETIEPAVHAAPETVKQRERKSNVRLESSSNDNRMIATPASDQNKKVVIDISGLDTSFLAPVPYSPSAGSVASSVGSPVPLISDQALSNAAFLFSPSYAGGEIQVPLQANSPRSTNFSTFTINTSESRGRLSTFSARSRPAFSIPISSAPDNMSSIRASRSSYSDDDITYSRLENIPSNDDGIQKHVHFSSSNDVFVLRNSNKARVAMGTPMKDVSPVIENKVSNHNDKGIPHATSTAAVPNAPASPGSFEKRSSTTKDLYSLHEVKAGAGDLGRDDDSGVESHARETSNWSHHEEESPHGSEVSDDDRDHNQNDDRNEEADGQNISSWSYREEDGVLCAATPLRATGRAVQHKPSLSVPANSPMLRFREAKIKFSSKPGTKVYIHKASSMKPSKPSAKGTVHSRVKELNNGRLKSNRQLVRKTPRRETGGENALAPRPATLNPVIMSYKDGGKSGPKYSIESQFSYEGMSDTGVSTVVSGDDEAERKAKYSIQSQSTYEEESNTGISMVSCSEDEAEHKPNYCIESSTYEGRADTVSTVAASENDEEHHIDVSAIRVDSDVFAKMMASPEESSLLSEDEDDAFAEIMKKSSPSFDDHKLVRTSGTKLRSLLSQYEKKSWNQQPARPGLSHGPIGTSLRSLVSEDPSALTFDTNNENSRPQTLSFTDKAKVNPREQQHHAPHGALCLSPLQRTPMQARKWRTLAAAAKEKDLTKKGSSKKGNSKKHSGLRERSSNMMF